MKERPILFSGPMVRALLDGGKTQTRRLLKPLPFSVAEVASGNHLFDYRADLGDYERVLPMVDLLKRCPYGQPGDRLWVRETFTEGWPLRSDGIVDEFDEDGNQKPKQPYYRASNPDLEWCEGGDDCPAPVPWRPSIHMPRAISRITLEVMGVRVERLQDISEADAMAEGSRSWALEQYTPVKDIPAGETRLIFRQLWEQINGPGSWAANPWVWVVEFRRLP